MPQPPPKGTPNLYGAWDKTQQSSNMPLARASQSAVSLGSSQLTWMPAGEAHASTFLSPLGQQRQACSAVWFIH